ncbi:MAG: hypothetical protein AAGH42_03085 [Pseudomonadota bacterium]
MRKNLSLKIQSSDGQIRSVELEPYAQLFKIEHGGELKVEIPIDQIDDIDISIDQDRCLLVFCEAPGLKVFIQNKRIF